MARVDAVTLEVMRNALQSVAEEMGVTLTRTALSPNIKDRRDCSTAIYTHDGRLVAQAEHIPLHLGLMQSVVKAALGFYPPDQLVPGDVIMTNDPYVSGSHLPDVCLFTPIFCKERMVAIAANLAHHVDIGGMAPGGMPVNAREIFMEGVRIPPIKIQKAGKLDEELLKLLAANVRTSFEFFGDIQAQLAANNIGARRFLELVGKYGLEHVLFYAEEIMNYAERRMRAAVREIGDRQASFEDYLEGDGFSQALIPLAVKLQFTGGEVLVDFTGTAPQVDGSINCTRAVTLACVYYALKSVLDPEVPPNDGAVRFVKVITPPGTIVNPYFPAAVSNANINTAQRIADVVLGAMGKILPEQAAAASAGTMALFTIGGFNSRTGRYYSYVETYGGGQGAVNGLDGMDGVHTNMTNTRNTPVEVIENAYPLMVGRYGLVPDSDGAGQYRGGLGMVREITVLDHEASVTLSTERASIKPWGINGGMGGANSACRLVLAGGEVRSLPDKITCTVPADSTIVYVTPGGGGYGPPSARSPEAVREDVLEGLVSPERAREAYYFAG